jgi:hypothetical protein
MKVYAPAVFDAVAESLRTVYWYQNDLKSFLLRAGVPTGLVNGLPWGQNTYKRTIVKQLIDRLASDSRGTPIVERLIDSLVEMDESLPHLARLIDGKQKADDGGRALRSLKDLIGRQTIVERIERARQDARTEADRAQSDRVQRQSDLSTLNTRFLALCGIADDSSSTQRRGFEFQTLLRDLFVLYDLDPRGSFAMPGQQVDGSITLDGTFILIEARWQRSPMEPKEVRDFQGKVQTKLDNTLGLMISMSGFNENAVAEAERSGRIVVVLMDGVDVAQVFQGVVDLLELLRRKLRHAAECGSAMHHICG